MNDDLKPYAIRAVDSFLEDVADDLKVPDGDALQALLVIVCGQLAHHTGAKQTQVILGAVSMALESQVGRELRLKLGLDVGSSAAG